MPFAMLIILAPDGSWRQEWLHHSAGVGPVPPGPSARYDRRAMT
jgi:hypothetical protein